MLRQAPLPELNADLLAWRRQVLSVILWVVVAGRTLQYLRFLHLRQYTVRALVAYTVLYLALVGLAVFRDLPHLLRGWCTNTLTYLFVVVTFVATGQYDGRVTVMLTLVPIYAAILYGRRSAWVAMGLSGGLLGGMTLVSHFGLLRHLTLLGPRGLLAPGPLAFFWNWMTVFVPLVVLQDRFMELVRRFLINETDLHRRLQEEAAERRILEDALIETSERERQSVGQELHDGVCQQITGVMLQCKVLEKALAEGKPMDPERFRIITGMLDGSLGQAHDLARGLSPGALSAEALVPSLKDLARRTRETFEVDCEVEAQAGEAGLGPVAATHLYRIAQEAVVNAIKHGRPRQILLRLVAQGDRLTLEVQNDGRPLGIPARSRDGMGLRIMRYRSEQLGGTLELLPMPGSGVSLCCTVPLGQA